MMWGLPEQTVKAIREIFQQHRSIARAVLYGSRAKGNYRPGSDIDLTLDSDSEITLRELQQIMLELDDLLLPYSIDLSLLDDIENPALLEHINRCGQLFYQRQKQSTES